MNLSTRKTAAVCAAAVVAGTALITSPALATASAPSGVQVSPGSAQRASAATFLVLGREGVSDASVRSAIAKAGGTVTAANTKVGLYTVSTTKAGFTTSADSASVVDGVVSADRAVAKAPKDAAPKNADVEKALTDRKALAGKAGASKVVTSATTAKATKAAKAKAPEPLASLQWDMDQIQAPQAHLVAAGTGRGVRVGIMDTGVDGSHPDIAPNFNSRLSRNFTTDDPIIDGSCADDPDGSCADPSDVDENGHGTHVASTIASPENGVGIAGVAPNAQIINLRTGQDSGYFFLAPTINALTYAAEIGVDVVNMSYYIDPWLYNCASNPADSAEEQREQRTTIRATNRALRYARSHGVTLVAAAGNGNTDLDNPTSDASSPDYPGGTEHDRVIDNSCVSMPNEGTGVVSVTSTGPSKLKADYSNWGTDAATVAAPGGYYRDGYDTDTYGTPGNLILAAMPAALAVVEYAVDPDTGESLDPFLVSQCDDGADSCAYWQYIQGTSMASPHAAGVAALIVGKWGSADTANAGVTLPAVQTERILGRTASNTPCPTGGVYDYPDRDDSFTATCVGDASVNTWYGQGIVNALSATSFRG